MITNRGKEIIAKYMLGQAPSYATHIALGCGAKPTIAKDRSFDVTNKSLSASVATLTTSSNHDFYPGDNIIVAGVGTPFNGTYTVVARPTASTLTYAVNSASVASASASGTITHDYSKNETMAFEMIRIPISSRGFVNENGVSKLALSAEMPTESRYEITEVALWSAGANSIVTNSDSRPLFTFSDTEGWKLHNTENPGSTTDILSYSSSLDNGDNTGNINIGIDSNIVYITSASTSASATYTGDNIFAKNQKVIFSNIGTPFNGTYILTDVDPINKKIFWTLSSASTVSASVSGKVNLPASIFGTFADNDSLNKSVRKARQEGSRFLNYTIFMRGDTSNINSSYVISSASAGVDSHIHLNGQNFNLSRNSPNDKIKIALSIVPKILSNDVAPYSTRIVVEFLTSELNPTSGYARLKHEIKNTDLSSDNRYIVITKELKDLETSSNFSWLDVQTTRIYVCVYKNNGDTKPSDEYYVVLDAMRFENTSTYNPLYAMSGYSVVDTTTGYPILKSANTSNYIEFRMTLGVA